MVCPPEDEGRGGAAANAMSLFESTMTGVGVVDTVVCCVKINMVSSGKIDVDTLFVL